MQLHKHYSFDLWFTLIKSNPEFKKQRAAYFFRNFNTKNKSLTEVQSAFRKVDLMCNAINEKTGGNIAAEEMYLMVMYEINGDAELFTAIDLANLYNEMERLLFNFRPVVFSEETLPWLHKLKERKDITTNILSNTAFIKGSTLRTILVELGIAPYFDFQLYSDELKLSKPNPLIFEQLILHLNAHCQNEPVNRNEIVHIGDNPIADIKGALEVGLQAFQVNSNNKTIKDIFA